MTITAETQRGAGSGFRAFRERFPDFIAKVEEMRRFEKLSLGKLASLNARGRRAHVRTLLHSPRLATLYAYEVMRDLQRLHSATPASIKALAARCDPYGPLHERVRAHTVVKNGRPRIVQDFGPARRLHHRLVSKVLVNLHPPRPDQFLFHGGMPKALVAIEAAFRDGDIYAVELDITNFYGSIRHDRLAELLHPLPASVIANVIRDERVCHTTVCGDSSGPLGGVPPSSSASAGLPMGAATSPIIGEIIIGKLLADADIGKVVTYADNLLILGSVEEETRSRAERLREQAAQPEAGALEIRMRDVGCFLHSDGVQFAKQVGTHMRHRLNWAPDATRQHAFQIADWEPSRPVTLVGIEKAHQRLLHWQRSYPMWRTGDRWVQAQLAELACLRFYHDARPENRMSALQAVILACLLGAREDVTDAIPDGATVLHRQRREALITDALHMSASMLPRTQAA